MSTHQIDVAKAIRAYATSAEAARLAKRTADQARRAARVLLTDWLQTAPEPRIIVDGTPWGLAPITKLVLPPDRWHAMLTASRIDLNAYLAALAVSRSLASTVIGSAEIDALSLSIAGEPDLRPL